MLFLYLTLLSHFVLSFEWKLNSVVEESNWSQQLEEHRIQAKNQLEILKDSLSNLLWSDFIDDLKLTGRPRDKLLHMQLKKDHANQLNEIITPEMPVLIQNETVTTNNQDNRLTDGNLDLSERRKRRSRTGKKRPQTIDDEADTSETNRDEESEGIENLSDDLYVPSQSDAPSDLPPTEVTPSSSPVSDLDESDGSSDIAGDIEEDEPPLPNVTEPPSSADDDSVLQSLGGEQFSAAMFLVSVAIVALCLVIRSCRTNSSPNMPGAEDYAPLATSEDAKGSPAKQGRPFPDLSFISADEYDMEGGRTTGSTIVQQRTSEDLAVDSTSLSWRVPDMDQSGSTSPLSALRRAPRQRSHDTEKIDVAGAVVQPAPPIGSPRVRREFSERLTRQMSKDAPPNIMGLFDRPKFKVDDESVDL